MRVGVIGVGVVGSQVARWCGQRGPVLLDDLAKGHADPIAEAGCVFVCVPTPSAARGAADLRAVWEAIGRTRPGTVVVLKSTVPPGTAATAQIKWPDRVILSNPEFLTASRAWEDFIAPRRQLVGFTDWAGSRAVAESVLADLPRAPVESPARGLALTATECELVKYALNVHYHRKVTWACAMARLAGEMGAEWKTIQAVLAADPWVGDSHLDVNQDGYRGVGGPCLPKDLLALRAVASALGLGEVSAWLESERAFNECLFRAQGLTPGER